MAGDAALEIVAILRAGNVVLPSRDEVLQEGDRLLTVGSIGAEARIAEHLVPVEPPASPAVSAGSSATR
jgi:Trk K+ transport system NAD-binding subunit